MVASWRLGARFRLAAVALACAVIVLGQPTKAVAALPTKGQSAVAQVGSGTTATATFSTNPAAGNTILAFVQTGGAITSVVDNGSTPTTFTRDVFTTAGKGAFIYRANNITLPASGSYKVTVAITASGTIQVAAIEFAGLASGPPSATNTGSGAGTAVSTNSVTSGGDAVFFGGFSDNSGLNPQSITFNSAGAGFTQDFVNPNGSSYWPAAEASATVTGTATQSISWTIGTSSVWGAAIAVYPAAGASGGDTVPPDTTITSGPPDPSTSSSASFSFTGTDDVTPTTSLTFDCQLDAETIAACTSPKSYSGLSDGSHTFQVRARDAAANVDPTPAYQTWQVNTGSSTGTDKLPDLGIGRASTFSIDTRTMPGHTLLRFSVVIANAGVGAFEVYGSRPSTSDAEMTVQQHIYQTTGGYRSVPTNAVMFYAGDGHNHWHVRNLEGAQLTDVSGKHVGGPYAKTGFCFSDNAIYNSSVPGTPSTAVYSGCANGEPDALACTPGLSVGWGDWYPANIAFQWIDITGLPYGTYRFWAFADPNGFFVESNEDDNYTWTDIKYSSRGVKATAYGPHI
jgi:Tfp pilus assembly protein FimT